MLLCLLVSAYSSNCIFFKTKFVKVRGRHDPLSKETTIQMMKSLGAALSVVKYDKDGNLTLDWIYVNVDLFDLTEFTALILHFTFQHIIHLSHTDHIVQANDKAKFECDDRLLID